MMESRRAFETVLAPLAAGLLVLLTLLGLIGTSIRDPRPHDIPVGVTGPSAAVQQLTDGFNAKSPGTFKFTTYGTEADARAALDSSDVAAVLVIGAGVPRLVVSGAAGDAIAGLTTAVFSSAFAAQGAQLSVEVAHSFASGDPHGLVLFFLVLATIVSTFVAQVVLFVRGRGARLTAWLGVTSGWAVLAGLTGTGMAAWIVGGYDISSAAAMAGLLALASLAAGSAIAGSSLLLGAPGLGLAGLVGVLLDLISSGGPAGPQFLPDAYRAVSPWMPAAQLFDSMRRALYFDGSGIATPVLVMMGWVLVGLVLMLAGAATRTRVEARASRPAVTS